MMRPCLCKVCHWDRCIFNREWRDNKTSFFFFLYLIFLKYKKNILFKEMEEGQEFERIIDEKYNEKYNEKQDILIKLKILRSVGRMLLEHSEDMCVKELREIYENGLSLYLRDKEMQDKNDLIRKIKWLDYDGDNLKSLDLKELVIIYSNILKEKNLEEKDMDNYIEMIGILMMFANK